MNLKRLRIAWRQVGVGALIGLATLVLWFWSGDRLLVLSFAVAATGTAFGALPVAARSRRKRRLVLDREKQARIEDKRRCGENKRRLAESRDALGASTLNMTS